MQYPHLSQKIYKLRSEPGTLVEVVEECPFQAGTLNSVEHANKLLNEVRLCRNALRRGVVLGDHKYRMFPHEGYDYVPQEVQVLINAELGSMRYKKLYDRVFLRSCLCDILRLLREQEPTNPPKWKSQASEIAYRIQRTILKLGGKCDISELVEPPS